MPSYKLTYFNVRARGEVTRLLFALADVPFDDCRVNFELWPAMKKGTPFGQLPILEVDGTKLCQSHAIERYLAKQFGFLGSSDLDAARVDMVMCCVKDFAAPVVKLFGEKDEEKKKEMIKKYLETDAPNFLDFIEKICAENATPGYFVGNKITLADLIFYNATEDTTPFLGEQFPGSWEKWPRLKAVRDQVFANPRIKAWLDKRPVTAM